MSFERADLKILWTIVVASTLTFPSQTQASTDPSPYGRVVRSWRVLPDLQGGWVTHPHKNFCGNFIVPNWLNPPIKHDSKTYPFRMFRHQWRFFEPPQTLPYLTQYGDEALYVVTSRAKAYSVGIGTRAVPISKIVEDTHNASFVPAILLEMEKNQAPSAVLDHRRMFEKFDLNR